MNGRVPFTAFTATLALVLPMIAASQSAMPSILGPCIRQFNTSPMPTKAVFVKATYQEKGMKFYFLHLFPPKMEQGVRNSIISTGPSGCQVLAQYPSGKPIPTTKTVPLSVARGLTLNILKSDIDKLGGPQKYQSLLNSASQDTGQLYLDPNEVWALQQLGIRLDPSIKISSPPISQD